MQTAFSSSVSRDKRQSCDLCLTTAADWLKSGAAGYRSFRFATILSMNTRKIWFRAKANSNNGSTHWFTIYQGRSVVIEAVISGKKRRGTASLPQLICFRCKPGVKSETDVFHALQTRFKVKGIKKFGG